jgi:tripartite-type tricarboxylate transporter receptor subunit TctC
MFSNVIATFASTRVEGPTHSPTVAEAGYNRYDGWFGLYAPTKVPSATMSQLIASATAAMQAPDAKRKLEPLGLYPTNYQGIKRQSGMRPAPDRHSTSARACSRQTDYVGDCSPC